MSRAQVLRKLQVCSSAGCVNFGQNVRFLQKFPVFPCFLFHAVCVFPILYVPQCKIFEPDQKIQTVAFAAVLIFCLERAYSNDKRSFVGVRIFHSLYHKYVINLRVSSYLCELCWACSYILGFPRRMPVGILVVVQTSHCSFSHTRIRPD